MNMKWNDKEQLCELTMVIRKRTNVCGTLQVVHCRRSRPDLGASGWTDSRERKVRLRVAAVAQRLWISSIFCVLCSKRVKSGCMIFYRRKFMLRTKRQGNEYVGSFELFH